MNDYLLVVVVLGRVEFICFDLILCAEACEPFPAFQIP